MKEALLYDKLEARGNNEVLCRLCSHYCLIGNGDQGDCLVRINHDAKLFTTSWGNASGTSVDPVEKKPFYHFMPGSRVLSFGTPGCNFKCENCQNWNLSRQPELFGTAIFNKNVLTPDRIVRTAIETTSDGIAYTYSEPTIFFEYALDVINKSKQLKGSQHLKHMFISNGFFSKELLDIFENEDLINAVNIDLKFISNKKYKDICGGRLNPVLRSIKRINDLRGKIHLEIINLIIPGENDNSADIDKLTDIILDISPDIPLHFSRFFPHYKMDNKRSTPLETMIMARETAISKGMKYVFVGNADLPETSNTYCPGCKKLLIERSGYGIIINELSHSENCPTCGEKINIVL